MKRLLHIAILVAVIVLALMLRDVDGATHPRHHVETCEGRHQ